MNMRYVMVFYCPDRLVAPNTQFSHLIGRFSHLVSFDYAESNLLSFLGGGRG